MLKNNEERKKYIADEDNWVLIYDLSDMKMKIYQLNLPDGTVIYRFWIPEERIDDTWYKGVHEKNYYRIKLKDHLSDRVSMSYLVDLLRRTKDD